MSYSGVEYLQHIFDETKYLIQQTNTIDKKTFFQDETKKRAFVRSLEIIGEAVKQMPDSLRNKYPSIEWKSIAGMRDRLIHAYFGIDYDIVWDIVINKIPALKDQVQQILLIEQGNR